MINERMQQLAGIPLFEEALTPKLRVQLDEFAENKDRQKRLEKQVKEIKSRNSELASILEPVVNNMSDRIAETDYAIVQLKRASVAAREKASYKDAFELALTKVNKATKRILEEALAETMKTGPVAAVWKTELKEGVLDTLKGIMSRIKKKVSGWLSANRQLKKDNQELLRLAKGK